ncbi:MAG TPA: PAS domain S-box protein, partial [Bacteroidales bacterium]|nr:PAS domain S-box protein [Bacteroidales bacterium]
MKDKDQIIKELTEQLNQFERKAGIFQLIADRSNDWEIFRDPSGKIVYINQAFERITGFKSEDLRNRKITEKEFVHPDDWHFVLEKIRKSVSQNLVQNLEFRIITSDKQVRYVKHCSQPVYVGNEFSGIRTSARDISDNKKFKELLRLEKKLKENQEKIKSFFEDDLTGDFLLDTNGEIQDCNLAFLDIFGYKKKNEIVGKNISVLYEDASEFESTKKILKKNRFIRNQECIRKTKEGNVIYVIENKAATLRKDGGIKEIKGYLYDISDRIRSEQELIKAKDRAEKNQESLEAQNKEYAALNEEYLNVIEELESSRDHAEEAREKFQRFFEDDLTGDFWLDPEGIVLDCNPAFLNIFGYKDKNEIIGKEITIFYEDPAEFESIKEKLQQSVVLKNYETVRKCRNGNLIYAIENKVASFDRKGNIKDIKGYLYDITGSKKAEQELIIAKEETEKNEKFLEEQNQEYAALNEEYLTLIEELQRAKDIAEESERNLKAINDEYEALNEELKQTNEELYMAKEKAEESDRLKTAFLQNMSHEIRTPLNAIYGFAGMLEKPEISPEKRKSFISIIQNSSNQLIAIVSDILTISSLETKQEKVDISKICINDLIVDQLAVFKPQAINQNLALYAKQQLTDEQSVVYTDKTKVTQILSNLITNALKFTHEGYIEFGYNLADNNLEFYVKDSGIGIKEELQRKIFDRFRQADMSTSRKYGGNGLGLSISKGLVQLLGGDLRVESRPGEGAVFYFTIPYKPAREFNSPSKPVPESKNKRTVLVAEDEEYNYLFIEELLNNADVKLIHARDGKQAVDICRDNNDIDLVLMDIKMPVMDGKSAAQLIKEFRPELPVIAQTAYALEQ